MKVLNLVRTSDEFFGLIKVLNLVKVLLFLKGWIW